MELWPAEALVVLALTKGLYISSLCAAVPVIDFSGCKKEDPEAWTQVVFNFSVSWFSL